MLQAALHMAGDQRYEADLRRPDLSPVSGERSNGWTFYSDRRRRGFMLATFVDLFGRDPAGEPLANLVAESIRGRASGWYTTQELVWSLTGLGKFVDAGAKVVLTADEGLRGGKRIPLKKITDRAIEGMSMVETVLVAKRTGADVPMQHGRDHWLDEEMAKQRDIFTKGALEHGVAEKTGFNWNIDYSALFMGVSDSPSEESASGGMFRFFGFWDLVDRGGPNKGSLNWKIEHRHKYSDIPPSALGFESGYAGLFEPPFNDSARLAAGLSRDFYNAIAS